MRQARFAALVAAVRRAQGLRQVDVAVRAGVSQGTVSRIERGLFERMRLDVIEAVGDALGIVVELDGRWHGSGGERLLDAAHATLVNAIVAAITERKCLCAVEYSFNHYGERGSVDILAWRADCGVLLIIEVKSRVVDEQEMLGTLDRKVRVVPGLVAKEKGWHARHLGVLLVLPDASGPRSAVARHPATFERALPARTREVTRWLAVPAGDIRGIWFLHDIHRERVTEKRGGATRVRRRKEAG